MPKKELMDKVRNKLRKAKNNLMVATAMTGSIIAVGNGSRSAPEHHDPHTMVQASVLNKEEHKIQDLKFEDALFEMEKKQALEEIKDKIDNTFSEKDEVANLIYDNVKEIQNRKDADHNDFRYDTPEQKAKNNNKEILTESGKHSVSVETKEGYAGRRGNTLRFKRQKECNRGMAVYSGRD